MNKVNKENTTKIQKSKITTNENIIDAINISNNDETSKKDTIIDATSTNEKSTTDVPKVVKTRKVNKKNLPSNVEQVVDVPKEVKTRKANKKNLPSDVEQVVEVPKVVKIRKVNKKNIPNETEQVVEVPKEVKTRKVNKKNVPSDVEQVVEVPKEVKTIKVNKKNVSSETEQVVEVPKEVKTRKVNKKNVINETGQVVEVPKVAKTRKVNKKNLQSDTIQVAEVPKVVNLTNDISQVIQVQKPDAIPTANFKSVNIEAFEKDNQDIIDSNKQRIILNNVIKEKDIINTPKIILKNEIKDEMICLSDAKSDYFLTQGDLTNLEYIEKNNPHYRRASSMKLFNKINIIDVFCDKYDVTYDQVEEKRKELLNMKNSKRTEKMKKRKEQLVNILNENRINPNINNRDFDNYLDGREPVQNIAGKIIRERELKNMLQQKGLQLRSDSKLCDDYIEGCSDLSVHEIVETMETMNFLYTKTNYRNIMNNVIENQRNNYYGDRHVDYVDASYTAKRIAIKEWIKKNHIDNLPQFVKNHMDM